MTVTLVTPATEHLASYADALRRGYSPSSTRAALGQEQLAAIEADPAAFLATHGDDPEGKAPPFTLPDGTVRPRLPGIIRWIWDGAFAGSLSLRWQAGTMELPPWVLGHVGYSVVLWRQGRGYATKSLALLLPMAAARGMPFVELTTDPDNVASQRVILKNGGRLLALVPKDPSFGEGESLLFRIDLA